MKVVDPIGRDLRSAAGNDKVLACYCGSSSTFASAKNENGSDTCWHCGCYCTSISETGTYMHAQVTFRTSS